jgi:NAD(P)-dependent dehydrogenase (short-subunit alcohol dehydrogenase family)
VSHPENRAPGAFRLDGQTALVTGAGRGIGRACAAALAGAGARVIAVARSEDDLAALETEWPGQVTGWACDVTDAAFPQRVAALERLDVLVNNVGTNRPQPFVEVDAEALDLMLNLNVRAAFLVAQAAAQVMLRQGGGAIVHMSSQMGHIGAARRTVYCMTKHAIEGLTRAMAVELAPAGIRVNAVAPTFIETPMTAPMLADPAFSAEVLGKIPLGRVGRVEEVANAVLFLASPAASLITGDSLKVDGGWTAQ